jgi:hypothetical protein
VDCCPSTTKKEDFHNLLKSEVNQDYVFYFTSQLTANVPILRYKKEKVSVGSGKIMFTLIFSPNVKKLLDEEKADLFCYLNV